MASSSTHSYASHSLSQYEVGRYSRQLLVPELGVDGQSRICKSSVLIIGAGGLGCPVAQYLASAGIGQLGIVDHDVVELDNLHRQVLHDEANVGMAKAESLCAAVKRMNSSCRVVAHRTQIVASNAADILRGYDIIVDCSDNAPTRYLINDACVLAGKPLVSGSALRWEGQLTVYNHNGGPCYRCIFPKPPPAAAVTNCSEGGVLGPVVGVIGSMQAMETLKLCAGLESSFSGHLFLFDGLSGITRRIKLRSRMPDCQVCGDQPTVTKLVDEYETFCGTKACDKVLRLRILSDGERLKPIEIKKQLDEGQGRLCDTVILDTRPPHEFAIGSLPNSLNFPLPEMERASADVIRHRLNVKLNTKVLCVCRRGNDSQLAAKLLREKLVDDSVEITDMLGGLQAYANEADDSFPVY